jgi:hypothetical protein
MKKLIAILSLIALPSMAHAIRPPIIGMASPRLQITQMAQQQGLMKAGSGQRLYLKEKMAGGLGRTGTYTATIKGIGGITGAQKNVTLATGTFKFVQEVDGQMVKNGKFNVREF